MTDACTEPDYAAVDIDYVITDTKLTVFAFTLNSMLAIEFENHGTSCCTSSVSLVCRLHRPWRKDIPLGLQRDEGLMRPFEIGVSRQKRVSELWVGLQIHTRAR